MAITILGAIVRCLRLDHPMRYDEAYTFLSFARSTHPADWFSYLGPNNHVLHTVLVHLATRLAGPFPAALRIPALLAGVLLIPSAAHLAWRLTNRRTVALASAALVAGSSLLIEYSVNARGYSMVCLATVWLFIGTLEVSRNPASRYWWWGWILSAALGTYTIPIMLYPVGMAVVLFLLQLWMSQHSRHARTTAMARLAIALVVAAFVTLLLYLPVIHYSRMDAILSNRFVMPRSFSTVVTQLPQHAVDTIAQWTRDAWLPWTLLLAAALIACVASSRRQPLYLLPILAPVFLACVSLAQRVAPPPRVWMFILPVMLVLSACGLDLLIRAVLPRRFAAVGPALLLLAAVFATSHQAWHTLKRPFLISEDDRTLVDAEAICHDAARSDEHPGLVSQLPADSPLAYYSLFHPTGTFMDFKDLDCQEVLIVVGDQQTLTGVLNANPEVAGQYGPAEPWRQYPHASVYLAHRQEWTGAPPSVSHHRRRR